LPAPLPRDARDVDAASCRAFAALSPRQVVQLDDLVLLDEACHVLTAGRGPVVARASTSGSVRRVCTSTLLDLGNSRGDVTTAVLLIGLTRASLVPSSNSSAPQPLTPRPSTAGAFDPCPSSGFVTKLDAAGRSLLYSTYLGGSGTQTSVFEWPHASPLGSCRMAFGNALHCSGVRISDGRRVIAQ
jgi:hypothetical protein